MPVRPDLAEPEPPPVRVELHDGPRAGLRALFEEAEDSAEQLDAYMNDGEVLVAVAGDRIVGHLQLVDDPVDPARSELKNMAVEPSFRGRGIGALLVRAAVERVRSRGRATLLVATAAADVGNLRFYQRAGFRMRSVERDAFTPATGYPAGIVIDGIELRDRVWLDLDVGVRRRPS
jgi:GNAT superfamily N-acetyltransferase